MRENGINRISAKSKKVVLKKDNLKEFEKLTNRRDIRRGKVNRLLAILEKGDHFETPLMTNIKNGRERLLDGNHRFEAIEKYLERHPERKVESWIFFYEELNNKEEKEIYTKWNLGGRQTANDFVKQYWDTFKLVRLIKSNGFPCDVNYKWTSKAIEFKLLVGAYLTKNNESFQGGISSAVEFIEDAHKLDIKDYDLIKAFMKDYISIFGEPDKKNMHYKSIIFLPLMRIWLDNRQKMTYQEMKNAFLKIRGHERVIYYIQHAGGSRDSCKQCWRDLVNVVNNNRTKKLFV